MAEPILSCRSLHVGYAGRPVVRDFDLDLAPGSIVALLGPNGAGKTTLLLTIAGLLPAISGTVTFDGDPVSTRRPERNTRRGLVLVPDTRELITGLTVRENLMLAARSNGLTVDDIVDLFPTLRARLGIKAGAVSGGEQQMLAVGRALIQRPKVLLIDEMTMGLAPLMRDELIERVRTTARATGVTALLVEQHVEEVLAHADEAIVLVHGEVRLAASAADLRDDLTLLEHAYLSN